MAGTGEKQISTNQLFLGRRGNCNLTPGGWTAFAGYFAAAVGIGPGMEQNANALDLIHGGETC
jgi:hypothetical protein